MPRRPFLSLACGLLVACGGMMGSREGPQDAATDDRMFVDAGRFNPDAGWTQCTSPSGLAVCGGDAHCSASAPECPQCGFSIGSGSGGSSTGPLDVCVTEAWAAFGASACDEGCVDGSICVAEFDVDRSAFGCAPFDLGVLFAKNGGSDRVRYADMGAWSGQPLPIPSTCPTIAGVQVCGGDCAPCSGAERCTGRSPLHPYSFCVPKNTGGPCSVGKGCQTGVGCFTYTVEAPVQALANTRGMCLPADLCKSAATGLPGGGTCSM